MKEKKKEEKKKRFLLFQQKKVYKWVFPAKKEKEKVKNKLLPFLFYIWCVCVLPTIILFFPQIKVIKVQKG